MKSDSIAAGVVSSQSQSTKVLHIITDLESGGAERMLCQLVTHVRDDVEHIVVSLLDEGLFGAIIRKAGVRLHCLRLRRRRISLFSLFRLARLLRQENPDVVQTWMYHSDLAGLLSSFLRFEWRKRVPLVWNIRCSAMKSGYNPPLTALVLRALAWLSKLPNAVVVNSKSGREDHVAIGYRPKRWIYIPNGFDVERFKPDEVAREKFRQEIGLPQDAVIVGMVARLDPMKDHASFLRAASIAQSSHPETFFVLVGRSVDEKAEVIAAGKKAMPSPAKVVCLGERGDVEKIMTAFDVLVLSSAFGEGFPNVLGEAMACGVPCIATDVGSAAEIVGATGIIVPPADTDALANAMKRFLSMKDAERRDRGRAARSVIETNFTVEKIAAQYRDLYLNLR